MSKLINTVEAALFLGLRPGTLEVWRCHGKGPRYSKIGRRVMYEVSDLRMFVESAKVETTDSYDNYGLQSVRGGC
ncbi:MULTISPECIES: helix-turn-helix transcriptional regulator [Maridesulfovibrio]|uniref:Helix-turn-helix domain-containing protein n=1 Tax=Maridesulfovibrio salexigens (strain ATCC 14822 / DSM 2638 / NCIMB 8403 / VKM B-1763) TaxID=526222 RepID=C6BZG0_MARSD|nr:helix-turn-helix domain-containing protein [Maridesulfovibrio salexigens]ACS80797.1 hypothetical protein Desal_2743 [Maridesulfovibrio salexigens DSM 2638]